MSNVKYKICSSGLEKVEANFIKVWVSKKKDIEFLEDDFILPSQCTHLVTKTNPELKKTEKILCALARGIPIIDYKHINKIIGTSNADAWNKEEYDIGGKYNKILRPQGIAGELFCNGGLLIFMSHLICIPTPTYCNYL